MADRSRSSSPEFDPLAFDEELTPLPEYKAAATTALDFDGLLPAPLKLHEDLKTGCGGQLWPAGMVLAKHMLRYHRDKLQDARMYGVTPSATDRHITNRWGLCLQCIQMLTGFQTRNRRWRWSSRPWSSGGLPDQGASVYHGPAGNGGAHASQRQT